MYKLYVIPGSHACRSGILMVEHKQVPYRRVDIPTLMHPLATRFLRFPAHQETRSAGRERPLALRFGDRVGTVPALAADGHRVSTNRAIARFLDEHHPDRPLLPAAPEHRPAVEEAERWANDKLQMAARRIALAWAVREPEEAARAGADGRMGYLLYKSPRLRRVIIPRIGRRIFAANPSTEKE